MKELITILDKNNYENAKTYIQSGNVVLKSKKNPDNSIASIVQSKFGFKPEIITLGESEFISAVKNNPYSSTEGKEIHFYFCKSKPNVDEIKLKRLKSESEKFHIKGKVLYLHAPDGIGRSKLVASIASCLGVSVTGRNLNTVNKILDMLNNE